MMEVTAVRFNRAGKLYYFNPNGYELQPGEWVVLDTNHGHELGEVVIPSKQVADTEIEQPLKMVVRPASSDDLVRANELELKANEALAECNRIVERLNLPMKLLSAEYNLDGNHITFYFSAAERVDFRELVRELAGKLKARIEMRQTGPRDEAKIIGGCGRCGRPLCCGTFLSGFAPVSIKMAKEQDLPLNPMKISGVCGRLMCCLTYENEQYRALKEKLPRNGTLVKTSTGTGKVIGANPLKQTVLVELETEATVELDLKEITIINVPQKPVKAEVKAEPKPIPAQDEGEIKE